MDSLVQDWGPILNFGQRTAVPGFHGSPVPGLTKLVPDPQDRKRMSSLGVWITSSKKHAYKYGDQIYEVEIPDGKYFPATTHDFDVFWFDERMALKFLTPGAKEDLFSKYGEPVLRYLRGQGPRPNPSAARVPKEKIIQTQLLESTIPRVIYQDWNYLKAWRAAKISDGYDGIVWKNSKIDVGRDGDPHDVYLIWKDIPVKVDQPESKADPTPAPSGSDVPPEVKALMPECIRGVAAAIHPLVRYSSSPTVDAFVTKVLHLLADAVKLMK